MEKRYESLEEALCKELELLDKKYGSQADEMSMQDVEKADKIYHALKSAATYHAMQGAEWEGEESERSYGRRWDGSSYARRRDSMGRYASGNMDGYSGHYPMYPMRYPAGYGEDFR